MVVDTLFSLDNLVVGRKVEEARRALKEAVDKLRDLLEIIALRMDSAVLVAAEKRDAESVRRVRVYAAAYNMVHSALLSLDDATAYLEALKEAPTAAGDLSPRDVASVLRLRLEELKRRKPRTTIDEWHITAYEDMVEALEAADEDWTRLGVGGGDGDGR